MKEVRTVLREICETCEFLKGAHDRPYDPTPSREDIEVTKRLTESGKVLGIDLLDHIIIGDHRFVSLKEKGYV